MKEEIHSKNIKIDYSDLKYLYSNQTMLQVSSDDVEILLGSVQIGTDGEFYRNMEYSVRLSHQHFKKFIKNCNDALKDIETIK